MRGRGGKEGCTGSRDVQNSRRGVDWCLMDTLISAVQGEEAPSAVGAPRSHAASSGQGRGHVVIIGVRGGILHTAHLSRQLRSQTL